MRMHARRRDPQAADELYQALKERGVSGPALGAAAYAHLLNVYAKAEHPPYGVPPRWAARAAEVAAEAVAAGITPDLVFMHCLLEAQAKAGRLPEALATFEGLRRRGLHPQPRTFSILFTAFRRARSAAGAAKLFDAVMPLVRWRGTGEGGLWGLGKGGRRGKGCLLAMAR